MTLYRPANLRPDHDEDRRFIIGTWSSSYKSAEHAGMISSEDWPAVMHRQIEKLITRPATRTIIAYEPPDFFYGFICGNTSGAIPVVHYVYVKGPYRSQEVFPEGEVIAVRTGPRHARGLFAELGVDPTRPFLYTCKTGVVARLYGCGTCRSLAEKRDHGCNKIPLAKFVPAAARYTNHQERPR